MVLVSVLFIYNALNRINAIDINCCSAFLGQIFSFVGKRHVIEVLHDPSFLFSA